MVTDINETSITLFVIRILLYAQNADKCSEPLLRCSDTKCISINIYI